MSLLGVFISYFMEWMLQFFNPTLAPLLFIGGYSSFFLYGISDFVDFGNFISYSVSSENISIIICGGMVGVVGIISGFAMKGAKKST